MNLAQSDPDYIPQASKDGRLALVRSVGPLSGGTLVKLYEGGPADNYQTLVVAAEIGVWDRVHKKIKRKVAQVTVSNEDLVIRRSGQGSSVAGRKKP